MKKTAIFTTLMLLLTMSNLFAQDSFFRNENKFDLNRNIILNHSSQIKEIPLNITSNTTLIKFEIYCELEYNELSIEILNPNGNIIGNFTVENMRKYKKGQKAFTRGDEYVETVSGQINKIVKGIEGKWKIVVKPKKEVKTKINIKVTQLLKD